MVWANYDIEEVQGADTSVNFLGAQVLSRLGIPTSAYQNFLLVLSEEYPVISPVHTEKSDGTRTSVSDEEGMMDTYRKLQYYQLFDGKEGR